MLIIGDVHCKIKQYNNIIKDIPQSIQLGDFGFDVEHKWHLENVDSTNHKILFGNHDDYNFLNEIHSLRDWTYLPKYDIFTVRGADSIDKSRRIEGKDWFRNEQLSTSEFYDVIDDYEKLKPSIVISHTCPLEVQKHLFGYNDKTTTVNGLQAMFEIHQPDMWIFGHHHRSRTEIINNTKFICLYELETLFL